MKIGELAVRAGINVQTVRFYEREGLLPKPFRTPSGYRTYQDRLVAR
jgi:DNA-binding transcriptional MerR regulator